MDSKVQDELRQKQQQLNMNIDLDKATPIKCNNKIVDLEKGIEMECGGEIFTQGVELKKLSALVSPNGQEAIVPVMAFACDSCGHINDEFQDAPITGQ